MIKLYIPLNIQRFKVTLPIESSVQSQSVENNNSVVRVSVKIHRSSGSTNWYNPNYRTMTINCDGQTYTVSTEFRPSEQDKVYSHDFTVPHNGDGTKYIEFSASLPKDSTFPYVSSSGSATLPTIPRQPNYTSLDASNITETSVRLTAGIDTHGLAITSGGWDVSTDGGASWTYYSGGTTDKTITGLQPNTRYWYRGYCQTAGGGSNSWWNYFDTYDYPKANAVNDITLKTNTTMTIGFYNPLGKAFSYQIISNVNNTVIYTSDTANITSATLNMNDLLTAFYNTIPSSPESTYYVKTSYSGNTRNSESKKYTIDANTCKPDMSTVTYADVNATTLALTNDNQSLINGFSTIQVIVADGNKATPKYGATISKYKIKNGDNTYEANESPGNDVVLTCLATSSIIEVYAIDSRGQSGLYTIANATLINYEPVTKNQSPIAQRCDSQGDPDGVGEYVKITLSGTFWNDDFGDVDNSITSISYNYANAQTPSQTTSGTTIVTATTSNNNYNVNQLILGDTPEGFDVANSYIINVTVGDELSSTTFTMTLGSGTPHIAYSPNGVSIMGKYNEEVGGLFQVGGQAFTGGDTLPINSIFDYDGSTVPDGYEEVADYSTNEVNTHQEWINGKDIYRKVVTLSNVTLPSGNYTIPNTNLNSLNLGVLLKVNITMLQRNNGNWQIVPKPHPSNSDWVLSDYYKANAGVVLEYGQNISNETAYDIYVILEYTKAS